MKFRKGAWLWASNVHASVMRRIESFRIENDVLFVEALDRTGNLGADRFEGVVLQMRVSSPMPGAIRVQVQHYMPQSQPASSFDIDASLASDDVSIDVSEKQIVYRSGEMSLILERGNNWSMRFEANGKLITAGEHESLGYMTLLQGNDAARHNGDAGRDAQDRWPGSPRPQHFMMQRLGLGVGECVYGLGERFGPLVKNGQSVAIWNEDAGTNSDEAYKNVPFYLSSRGYGVFVNSPAKVEFEIGTERVSQVQFSVPGEELDYYVMHGPSPKDVLEKYTRLTGRPAAVPAWSLGLWLSTSFTTQYDEKTVTEFVDGMLERGIPLKVFHFDCFWMKQRHWCDFEWDRQAFPDPEGMLKRLKAKGLKICVWINPYISGLSKLFPEGRDKGYFIKDTRGSVFQRDQWQPSMALVDFTNPAAVKWYQSKLKALLDMGVDCFKTDFGERIPVDDVVYHDGSDPALMHNYYAYVYNKAVFDLLEEYHGKDNAIVFARSATTGSQKMPVHWGGDCEATWESMAEDLRGGLSFCLSGNAYWSHDIGGFAGKANAALYKRWLAFGLLSSHSRLHGSESYRVPWLFDEESVDVARHFGKLKNRLVPYLHALGFEAKALGHPVMRAMVLEFASDPATHYLDRQYMLGSDVLVAPIFNQDSTAEYYLPAGTWTDLQSHRRVEGGQWIREQHDFFSVPLFVKENSIVPMGTNEAEPSWTNGDVLELHVFEMSDGGEARCSVVCTESSKQSTFVCRRVGDRLTLELEGSAKSVKVVVRNTRLEASWDDLKQPLEIDLSREALKV